jgi:DNA invertase Pin-like site-specific DNA recombinase
MQMSYICCRISKNTGGCSLDYQEKMIREFIQNDKENNIKNVIRITSSAYKKIPTELEKLKEIRNGRFVFYAIDRFARNSVFGKKLAEEYFANGNILYFIREDLLIDKAYGKNWKSFCQKLLFAEQESINIGRRIKDAKLYLKNQGFFTGSKIPTGFKKRKLDNGRSILEKEDNYTDIKKFIIACKSPGSKISIINKLLKKCMHDNNIDDTPLVLSSKGNKLITDLTYKNISDILNEYNINGGSWTLNKVVKIHNDVSPDTSNFDINNKTDNCIYQNDKLCLQKTIQSIHPMNTRSKKRKLEDQQ